ncbi:MAG: AraC family transcriptional regulator [Oscillospiraceae bacterium]
MENLLPELIANAFPEISVNAYMSHPAKGTLLSNLHIHNEIELMYVKKGEIRWTFPGTEVLLREGECLFVNSRVPHSTYALEDSSYFLVQFSRDKLLSGYTSAEKYLYYFILVDEKEHYLFDLSELFHRDIIFIMNQMLLEQERCLLYREIFIHSYAMQLIATLMRQDILSARYTVAEQNASMQKILPVITYINANYPKTITLELLSSYLGFHPAYLCRIFKKATNRTMSEYLNFVRIEKSLKLLAKTEDHITEIALNVGFSNISHFNTCFRRQIGCSPSVYRKTRTLGTV